MRGCGSWRHGRVWEQGIWDAVGAGEMGGCGNRGDGRVWEQWRL